VCHGLPKRSDVLLWVGANQSGERNRGERRRGLGRVDEDFSMFGKVVRLPVLREDSLRWGGKKIADKNTFASNQGEGIIEESQRARLHT